VAVRYACGALQSGYTTKEAAMHKIVPTLWFDDRAEEAAQFYASVFKNASIGNVARYGNEGTDITGKPAGTVMTAEYELEGQPFLALNGGPQFKFSEAVSFMINCDDQSEVDYFWEKLSEGGEEGPCGWLKDKYGLSWQVVPIELGDLLSDPDREKADRVMKAMLQMHKIDIAALRQAAES
jgi:predicted 3-demethylubiquinone-9 3-methyltransferase (glyoxalase superfamily)